MLNRQPHIACVNTPLVKGCWGGLSLPGLCIAGRSQSCFKVYPMLSLPWIMKDCSLQQGSLQPGSLQRGGQLWHSLESPTEASPASWVAPGRQGLAAGKLLCPLQFDRPYLSFQNSQNNSDLRFGFPLKNWLLGTILLTVYECPLWQMVYRKYETILCQI